MRHKIVCEDITNSAVITCIIQSYRELMGEKHQFIDIEVYRASPQRHTVTECGHHKQEQLTDVCYSCHQIFCMRCDMKTGCVDKTGIYTWCFCWKKLIRSFKDVTNVTAE